MKVTVTALALNDDEIPGRVERVRERFGFDGETAACLMIDVKLFSEVMLHNKEKPLFSPLMPHFREFMKRLKNPPAFEPL